jgi:outer membrane protein assembly factor BamB/tetratricopeptide (TPR) repeat protein
MSWSRRRATLVLALLALLGVISLVGHLDAQVRMKGGARPVPPGGPGAPGRPGAPPVKPSYDLGSLTLPKNDDLKDRIDSAIDRIKKKEWAQACETLQSLVGRPNDEWVPLSRTDPTGREIQLYGSVKKEALRLIGTLPQEGRSFYEATYGPKAETIVKQARTNGDPVQMGQALSLYYYTPAGAEAANWLGTFMLDRAQFQGARNYFMQLVLRAGIKQVKTRTLVKVAYAFHQAGDEQAKQTAFKELEKRGVEIRLRDESKSVAELQEVINRTVAHVSQQSASDSPIYRGRPNRNAMLPSGTPFLEAAWRQRMFTAPKTTDRLKTAETAMLSRNLPILSTFFPVTATVTKRDKKSTLLIYRSFKGIVAVDMKTGKQAWDSTSDWGLDTVLRPQDKDRKEAPIDAEKVGAYEKWLDFFLQAGAHPGTRPQIVFENSVLGTLSADSKMVYAIDDLALPPPQSLMFNPAMGFPGGGMPATVMGKDVAAAVEHNKLQAFDLSRDGSLKWELGTPGSGGPLEETFFLGAPLPVNDRLYVLTEKKQELRLATLEPTTGKVLAIQSLANTKDLKLSQDPLRRTQATHLAYGEGILVVPTNAGAVFGIDLLSNSLVWAYPYRETPTTPQTPTAPMAGPGGGMGFPGGMPGRPMVTASMDAQWQVTAPIVQDGKVVFTAPDAKSIHCVSLRDGTRLWTQARHDDDLFLAGVFNGKVVIVGKRHTRARSLARGELIWELETGLPSGQGAAGAPIAGGDVLYYLPVREAINTREPEICAINVDMGIIHAHTRSRKKEVPGNLLFFEGTVLSQTHNDVVAYPQLEVKLAEMDRLVKENPNNPVALTDRGDYLLDKGDLPGAIADFRKALKNKPPEATLAKARTKLYEAFTEYFQRDFGKAEQYIKEYEEMCRIDLTGKEGAERTALMAEMRRRRANYLCLVGKGREAQNRLVEAFEKYLELGEEAKKDELIQVVDEPSVKAAPDVWSQGRIAAMVANANNAQQKKALEDLINAKWSKLKQTSPQPLPELRKFVSLFGSLFSVGKEARLALAERLMEDPDVNSLLEAEQQLSLMRGEHEPPEVAARAIEALARLNTRKGLLEDAAYYYRLLGEKYPKVSVEGKRGEEYLDDLATDKRFLPYLDQPGRYNIRSGQKVELKHDENKSSEGSSTPVYQFGHSGESLPFFARNKLGLVMAWNHSLKLTDTSTGEERWTRALTPTQFQQIATNNTQPHRVKFGFQSLGHLVVLQLGHMVFGIDPLNNGRVIWERNLSSLPGSAAAAPGYQSLSVDPRDGSVMVLYSDGWMQRLGEIGPLQGGVVCLQMRDALTAVDPVSGRTLWTRTDVNSRSHIFGDEQHVYVVGMGSTGATGTRVFRAYDGVSVKVPDFSHHYDQRIRMLGRNILASEPDPKNQTVSLRIYDVLQGKDLWKQSFPGNSIVLQSEDPRLAGVIEPNGTVRVIDVLTQKELLNAPLADAKHVAGAQSVTLVSDPDSFYLAINGPADPNVVAVQMWMPGGGRSEGGIQSNMAANSGLRSVPINGMIYAFSRKTGKWTWYNEAKNQHMVVSMFAELPMVICTSRYMYSTGNAPGPRTPNQRVEAIVWAKHNGKLWYRPEQGVPGGTTFHALSMDHRSGKVELAGNNLKVTLTAVPR